MTSTAATRTDVPNNVLSHRKPPLAETYPRDQQPRSSSTQSEVSMLPRNDASPPASNMIGFPLQERLLNAREVAARLGVSERWVRDHTTRRSPKIRAVKLGTLIRYRRADVEIFMENLDTFHSSRQPRFGV